MNKNEKKLLSIILDMAASEFSSHGCNDFNLAAEMNIPVEEARVFANSLRKKMVKLNIIEKEDAADDIDSDYFADYVVMILFRDMLK